jgi:hypothetical protein
LLIQRRCCTISSQCDSYSDLCTGNEACYFRDYINDVASTAAIYSFAVQSIHYLLAVIFVNNTRIQMYQLRLILCIIQWLVAFLFPLYFIYLQPQLEYDPVSYVCVVSENASSFLTVYTLVIGFLFPLIITISVYIKLFLFVRRLRRSASIIVPSSVSLRAAKRILILLATLILGSIPGTVLQSMKPSLNYQYRIYYFSVTIASFCCLICMFGFTKQIKQWRIRWKTKIESYIRRRNERTIAPQVNLY